jgi:hypothetical protein
VEAPEPDRDERDREPDRYSECRPLGPLVGDCPQRPEQGRAEDQRKPDPQARIRKTLAFSTLRIPRLEEADLPQQRARDRQLDRDHRLEELNGDVHGRVSSAWVSCVQGCLLAWASVWECHQKVIVNARHRLARGQILRVRCWTIKGWAKIGAQ